jgi:hypothetical protein
MLLGVPWVAPAQSPDFQFRFSAADVVMVARVCALDAAFEVNEFGDSLIVSRARLCPGEVLKGEWLATNVFRIEGGTVGDITLELTHLPLLQLGDRALFLLERSDTLPDTFELSDAGYGFFEQRGRYMSDYGSTLTVTMAAVQRIARESRLKE